MAKITEAMLKKYRANDGYFCPYCGSENISADTIKLEGLESKQNIGCFNCRRHWTDTFTVAKTEGWDSEPDKVDVIISGYKWKCPNPDCKEKNYRDKWTERVQCGFCERSYEANLVKD